MSARGAAPARQQDDNSFLPHELHITTLAKLVEDITASEEPRKCLPFSCPSWSLVTYLITPFTFVFRAFASAAELFSELLAR
jgi:hypothetical protein